MTAVNHIHDTAAVGVGKQMSERHGTESSKLRMNTGQAQRAQGFHGQIRHEHKAGAGAAERERKLSHVVAVSEDGDTVQVSEEGEEKLSSAAGRQILSYAGISDANLEEMYLKGEISQITSDE